MMIRVPDPDPDWQKAAHHQGPQRNPAIQFSLWEQASGFFRAIAVLAFPLADVARRFRLTVEESWDNPSPAEAAIARVKGIDFAFSSDPGATYCTVWLHKTSSIDVEGALTALLAALGVDWAAITHWRPRGDDWVQFTDGSISQS